MRITVVTFSFQDGAGIALEQICNSLSADHKVVRISADNQLMMRIAVVYMKILSKFDRIKHYAPFALSFGMGNKLYNLIKASSPDLIILGWGSFILSPVLLNRIKNNMNVPIKAVVLDDEWITAFCHNKMSCSNFEKGCINCPIFSGKDNFMIRALRRRRTALNKCVETFIVPSKKMLYELERSTFTQGVSSRLLYLGVTTAQRHNENLDPLQEGRKVILVRYSSEPRKGIDKLVKKLNDIQSSRNDVLDKFIFKFFGEQVSSHHANLLSSIQWISLGYLSYNDYMSHMISSDIVLVTSTFDAGPHMVNQAVFLQKFIISTPVGVASELINDNNGYLLRDVNLSDLHVALSREDFSSNGNNLVEDMNSYANSILEK